MQLGSCDYILKPVDYNQLKETLKEIVQRIARREQAASRQRNDDPMPFHAPGTSSNNPYIASIIAYISVHLTEPIAIADLAEVLHLNPQYVMRLFKKRWDVQSCSILRPKELRCPFAIWKKPTFP